MGWTEYGFGEVIDPKTECDRLCAWENEGSKNTVEASSMVGSTYYAAVKIERADEPTRVVGFVFLTHARPFAYKDMDEGMGPCEDRCPRFVLEKLTPLPARAPVECSTCNGTGKIPASPTIRESYHGTPCYMCDGEGSRDRHDHARAWRKRCWARFAGGEPQGFQMDLLGSVAA